MDLMPLFHKILKQAAASMNAEEPSPASELYTKDLLGADEPLIENMVLQAYQEGYIDGAKAVEVDGSPPKVLMSKSYIRITIKGAEYLHDNTLFKRASRKVGEIKEFIPSGR